MENVTYNFKLEVEAGKKVFGSNVGPGNDPHKTVLTLKEFGYDFAMLEFEHALMNKETVIEYVRAGKEVGMPILMRPEEHFANFRCFLDAGLNGVMLPLLEGVEQAAYAVKQAYFPPTGRRGCGIPIMPYSIDFQNISEVPLLTLMEYINNNTVIFVQTESLENISNLHNILKLEGITGTIAGPYDLALNIGGIDPKATGDEVVNADIVTEKLKQVAKICKEAGKVAGIGGFPVKRLAEWAKRGYQLIMLGYVIDGNVDSLRPRIEELKSLMS